jgi:transcriptional regulator with XRE-family HTH domain
MGRGIKPSLDRHNLIRQLRAEGHTLAEIAQLVGVTRQAVHNALRRKHKFPDSTICSYCRITQIPVAGIDDNRKVACRKCLDIRKSIPPSIRLTSLRIQAQMSQLDLAVATGLSQSLISILETDSHNPRPETWERLITYLTLALAKDSKAAGQGGK